MSTSPNASRAAPTSRSFLAELRGGLSAAVIVVPFCVSYGLLAFAALGPAYANAGIVAGFIAAIVTPLVAAALGLRGPLIFIPRSISAVVLASFMVEFVAAIGGRANATPMLIAQALFLFVFCMGAFELLFGVARFGRLAKYLPAPVVAGFQCGIALVLLLSQIGGVLGADQRVTLATLPNLLQSVHPLAPLVAGVTLALVLLLTRFVPRWPVFAVALAGGTLAQILFATLGGQAWLGSVIGALHFESAGIGPVAQLADAGNWAVLRPLLPLVLGWALTGAVMSSVDTLIGLRIVEDRTETRLPNDAELKRDGVANLVTALCGGMHGGINVASSLTNLDHGGRTRLSTVVAALAVALVGLALLPLLAWLPRAAISAMLVLVAWRMFDGWTIQIARATVMRKARPNQDVAGMLGTVIVVAGLAVATNLLVAVAAGVAIAIISFIWRMSRTIIRRRYTVRDVQSRNIRAPAMRALLLDHGERVVVFELEGPLFFGTAEKLTDALDALASGNTLVAIADFQRINNVDSTGVRLLTQVHRRLARRGTTLVVSGVAPGGRIARLLADFGLTQPGLLHPVAGRPPVHLFHDVDRALEWAEDRLLETLGGEQAEGADVSLATLDMLRGFSAAQIDRIGPYLKRKVYRAGEVVFRAGDHSRDLYAIAAGRASVTLDRASGADSGEYSGDTRLVTFSAGAFFGEFALLDRQPRSATVRADTELLCHVLEAGPFEQLQREHPDCAIKLLANLGRELSTRLRSANQTIRVLGQ